MNTIDAKALQSIAKRYGIIALYLFGSRAQDILDRTRGKRVSSGTPGSDVDVGALPHREQRLTARERVRLSMELEDLFGVERVDLVVLSEADTYLAVDAIRGELIYSGDPDEQAEYELYILRRAGDLANYQRERINQILSGKGK